MANSEAISRDAKILVLGRHGYETAVEGKNGFVCGVERGWAGPIDEPGFWNPKNRSPICYNPPAACSVLPLTIKRTELAMAGKSRAQIQEWEKAAYAKKELPTTLEPGAMSYMISKEAYLTDEGHHNLAHLMLYASLMDKANWGADVPNSPVIQSHSLCSASLRASGRMELPPRYQNDPDRGKKISGGCGARSWT